MKRESKFTKDQKVWIKATVYTSRLDEDGDIELRIAKKYDSGAWRTTYANPSEICTTEEIWNEHVNGSDNHIGEFDTPYIKLSTLPPITKSENPEYYVKAEMVLKGKEYCHMKVVDYFGGSVLITVPASHVQNMSMGQSLQTQS